MFELGIERLLKSPKDLKHLKTKRVALVAHQASLNQKLVHSLDALQKAGIKISSAFGPQHGMRGEKQYNMIESDDYTDPVYGFPVFSLYGKVRRPSAEMMKTFDIVLYDLQDVGCRIFTYLTTLLYVMDECEKYGKSLWVLDRPNPAGRGIEGNYLDPSFESFVGYAELPIRHGMTMGEIAKWYYHKKAFSFELKVFKMGGFSMSKGPGFGWPEADLPWINPSPNMPCLSAARVYPGTVLLEGVNLSEGRGTTRPLEIMGCPGLDTQAIQNALEKMPRSWKAGFGIRPCFFEPTFDKFKGEFCAGFQVHAEDFIYDPQKIKIYRFILGLFKTIKKVQPSHFSWRKPGYEYDFQNLPIDLVCGNSKAREWVDDAHATWQDFDAYLSPHEKRWAKERKPHLLYK